MDTHKFTKQHICIYFLVSSAKKNFFNELLPNIDDQTYIMQINALFKKISIYFLKFCRDFLDVHISAQKQAPQNSR